MSISFCASGALRITGAQCAPLQKMLKEVVTKSIGYSIWQKGYHDHIIRGEADYLRIWNYIDTNPAKWREDCYYTETEG